MNPIQTINTEETIGDIFQILGANLYILFLMKAVTVAILRRHKKIQIPRASNSGGASDIFHIASNIRNILHPNAHGVNHAINAIIK